LPESVTNIATRAVQACHALEDISVVPGNPAFSSAGGILFDKARKSLLRYPQARSAPVTIPDTVEEIADSAFEDCFLLREVVIPDSVLSIGQDAFKNCRRISGIRIPGSVTAVGGGVFDGCARLAAVTLPDRIENVGRRSFADCASLSRVTLPDSVKRIGIRSFENCVSLREITVPTNVGKIENGAFAGCLRLRAMYFRGNAPELGEAVLPTDREIIIYCQPAASGWRGLFGGHQVKREQL